MNYFVLALVRAVIYAFFIASNASAASITILSDETSEKAALIRIDGDFEFGDDKTFSKFALQFDRAIVILSSDGGSLTAGLGIGKAIRLKQYSTFVENASTCTSACALAWLGGVKRSMEAGAKIGFHAAYLDKDGSLQESGLANALVGSYLNQLGLPESAVGYITHAAPQSMQWLTHSDAEQIGLTLSIPTGLQSSASPDQPPPKQATEDNETVKVAVGIDLFGFDLPGMPIRNSFWDACTQACKTSANCRAFTFNSKSKTCFLKTDATLGVRYAPATSAFEVKLESKIQLSQLNILQRTDVVGNDFQKYNNVSMEQCLRYCDTNTNCRAFSYIPKKNQCWLKSAAGTKVPKVGVVSGVK